MYRAKFGKRFSQLLSEKGWEDSQAASVLHVSVTMIVKYKRGENFPITESFFNMADVFGVSSDWLAGRSDVREIAKLPVPPGGGSIQATI